MEITGKYTKANILTENIEESAIKQITYLCNHPLFKDKKICIMPDVHASKATVVGLACEIDTSQIIPQLLGNDLCCSISCWEIKGKQNDWSKLDKIIKNMNIECPKNVKELIANVCIYKGLNPYDYYNSFATLGKGNHFISVEQTGKRRYLITHTGSRNLGNDVALYYSKLAQEQNPYKEGEEKQLSWLNDLDSETYCVDLDIIKLVVYYSHMYIADYICKQMKWKMQNEIFCPHNYIDGTILHKGSIYLGHGKVGIIPINMAEGSLIVRGYNAAPLQNYLYSAPHGAGRAIKRMECSEKLDMKEYKNKMKEIYCSNISTETIDESPMAYKSIDEITQNCETMFEVVDRLTPLYVYKEV